MKKRELLLVKIKTFIYARILVLLIYLFFSFYNFTQFFNPGVNQHWQEDMSADLIVFLSLEAFISKLVCLAYILVGENLGDLPNINIHNLVNTLHQPISVVFGGKRTVFVVVLVQLEGSAKNIWFFVHFTMRNGPRTTKEIGLKRELI